MLYNTDILNKSKKNPVKISLITINDLILVNNNKPASKLPIDF